MWIMPKNLPTYHSVLATKGLVEDCEEFSQMSEKSLMWRSKPSQSQTWSRRWKRVSYIQRLSTQTLKPSHSKNFVTEYLSYQQAFPVSRSRLLVRDLPQKIRDTFTPLSQEESQSADQLMLFSKMSKGLSQAKQPMGSRYSSMSSEIWKKEVIRLRGEYSLRLKLALHTSGREFLSWPTAKLRDAVESYENWPTADTTNIGDGTPWEKSKRLLKERRARVKKAVKEGKTKAGSGRSVNLAMAVQREKSREEKNWPTPRAANPGSRKPGTGGKVLGEEVKNWATPNTMDHLPPKEGEAMERIYETHRKGRTSPSNLREQVNPKSWPTPTRRDYKGGNSVNHILNKSKTRLSHIGQLPNAVKMDGLQDQDKSNTNGKNQESPEPPKMKLNPNWVEQIMGLSVGWT